MDRSRTRARDAQIWLPIPRALALGKDEIHIWRTSLDRDACSVEALRQTLSADERERAERFRLERDRVRFVVGRGTLRKLIERYTGSPSNELRFEYSPYGKPAIAENSAIHFNVAHSHDLALYAFARDREVGVDVERIRPEFASEDIAARYFSPRELTLLRALPPERRTAGFFNCWTRKEAYTKATGLGLQIALDSFSVELDPDYEPQFLLGVDKKWKLVGLLAANLYPAALVYWGKTCEVRAFSGSAGVL